MSVPSVPYVEALLWLRSSPQAHSAAEVARALYVPEGKANELLLTLTEAGLTQQDAEHATLYRFAPRDSELASMIDQLAECYRRDTIAVTRLIHDSSQRSARLFADAFKLRREKP